MADLGSAYLRTEGGIVGRHPDPETLPVQVAPASGAGYNTIRTALIPFACWRIAALRFEFDCSILRPQIALELQALHRLITENTNEQGKPRLSVFGHADPVGDDSYNKQLSGRRAKVIYALLVKNADLWEELYTQPLGGDSWREKKAVPLMMAELGYGTTTGEVERFQRDHGLGVDGVVGPDTRRGLFRAYMDHVCPFTLEPTDFLGQGTDAKGKADYQGCGEFNPVLLFSAEEETEYAKPHNKAVRDEENAPNRRVMVFLFRPGTHVTPDRWPCPRSGETDAACKKRFWKDGEDRRKVRLPGQRREYEATKDTFACRFYDRLADGSPCERLRAIAAELSVKVVRLKDREPLRDATVRIGGPLEATGVTGADGYARFHDVLAGEYEITATYEEFGKELVQMDPPARAAAVAGAVTETEVVMCKEVEVRILCYNVYFIRTREGNNAMITAGLLPHLLNSERYDAIILSEVFEEDERTKLLDGLYPVYPYRTSVVDDLNTLILAGLEDGGVMVVGSLPIQDHGHHVFTKLFLIPTGAEAFDVMSNKGVKHASFVKDGERFHLFGSHTQSGPSDLLGSDPLFRTPADIRRRQFIEIRNYIVKELELGPGKPSLEPIIIGGDLNVDMHHDVHTGEMTRMLGILGAALPGLQGHPFTWDAQDNDLARASGDEGREYLDYALPCRFAPMPVNAIVTTRKFRTPQPWGTEDEVACRDLSDHYAVEAVFKYRL
jgi:hypothetical protein